MATLAMANPAAAAQHQARGGNGAAGLHPGETLHHAGSAVPAAPGLECDVARTRSGAAGLVSPSFALERAGGELQIKLAEQQELHDAAMSELLVRCKAAEAGRAQQRRRAEAAEAALADEQEETARLQLLSATTTSSSSSEEALTTSRKSDVACPPETGNAAITRVPG